MTARPPASVCHVSAPGGAGRTRQGMTILEVVLALAVFSIAVMALVGTLNQVALAGVESQKLLEVEQTLESLIDEYGKMPQIAEMEQEIKPGVDGVAYKVRIQQVKDLRNQEGRFLQNTFRIQVVGRWLDGGSAVEMSAETLRYAGAFMPLN